MLRGYESLAVGPLGGWVIIDVLETERGAIETRLELSPDDALDFAERLSIAARGCGDG